MTYTSRPIEKETDQLEIFISVEETDAITQEKIVFNKSLGIFSKSDISMQLDMLNRQKEDCVFNYDTQIKELEEKLSLRG